MAWGAGAGGGKPRSTINSNNNPNSNRQTVNNGRSTRVARGTVMGNQVPANPPLGGAYGQGPAMSTHTDIYPAMNEKNMNTGSLEQGEYT